MTKNDVIRELVRCKFTKIRRLRIIYHNLRSSSFYFFDYDYKTATAAQKIELCECLLSLYKLRKSIVGLSAIYLRPNYDGIFVPVGLGFFDTRFRLCNNVSDFIKTLKK